MNLRTCVSPEGHFIYGIHRPRFSAKNMRQGKPIDRIGALADGSVVENRANFPDGDLHVSEADWVYEIPNAFPFKGTTYISKYFADTNARNPEKIGRARPSGVSLSRAVRQWATDGAPDDCRITHLIGMLPEPLQLALATTSTDPAELICLARLSGHFVFDASGSRPVCMRFAPDNQGRLRPLVENMALFKAVANNPCLPDSYKKAMVLRPGVQGDSEITGQWSPPDKASHVFEYLRRNSYIPWGHYAANMADDAVRYRIQDLTPADMTGIRHLYYQRTYMRLAEQLHLPLPHTGRTLEPADMENLRRSIIDALDAPHETKPLTFNGALWGWNYGFDYAPTGYRLHGSHQQIHQQYALIPRSIPVAGGRHADQNDLGAFACGDLIAGFIHEFCRQTGQSFFDCYIRAIRGNQRTDGNGGKQRQLVVYETANVMVFVPKAQTSQWELQVLALQPVGNILEADMAVRRDLDHALLVAAKTLSAMGADMITGIEYSKRFDDAGTDQRLMYCLLPRLPQSPGAFSEAQLRWINRHYPEDFAAACRAELPEVMHAMAG